MFRHFVRAAIVFLCAVMLSPVAVLAENYAVLFSGGSRLAKNYLRYYDNTLRFYNLLVDEFNYDPSNIWIVASDGTDPADDISNGTSSDWSAPIAAGATVFSADGTNLEDTITGLNTGPADLFLFWTFDHGGGTANAPGTTGEETLTGWGTSYADEDVDAWVDEVDAGRIAVVYGQCFSGGILDNHNITSGSGMFGCAATNHYESSYGDGFVGAFSDGIEDHGYTTCHDLYQHAYENDPYATDGEGPGGTWADGVEHPWKVGDDLDLAVANWVGLGAGGSLH